jgi:omega-6 fatty acid desaturase (delta-12 desaturase)
MAEHSQKGQQLAGEHGDRRQAARAAEGRPGRPPARVRLARRISARILASEKQRRLLAISNLCTLVFSGGVLFAIAWMGGAWAVIRHYVAPVFVAAARGALITLLHHSNESALYFDEPDWNSFRGQIVSTFNVRYPRWVEYLIFDINIHLPHHIAPAIPWYHLRAANDALRAAFPEFVQEPAFSWAMLRRMWDKPLLERKTDYYALLAHTK